MDTLIFRYYCRFLSVFRFLIGFYFVTSRFSIVNLLYILSPLKSAYSICFHCRFWSCFDLEKYEKPVFLWLPVFYRFKFYHHWNQRGCSPLNLKNEPHENGDKTNFHPQHPILIIGCCGQAQQLTVSTDFSLSWW